MKRVRLVLLEMTGRNGTGELRPSTRWGCLLLFAFLAASVGAQQPSQEPPQPPVQGAAERETSMDLTSAAVQSQIIRIESATDLPDAAKTEVLSLYRQVLELLKVIEGLVAKTKEYQKGIEEAPELLKGVQAEVAAVGSAKAPPVNVSNKSLEELTALLSEAEAALKNLRSQEQNLADESRNRAARMAAIPDLIAGANKRLEGVKKELNAPQQPGTLPQVQLARRTLQLALKQALEEEVRAYEAEVRFYTARSDLLSARRELAKLQVSEKQALVQVYQSAVNERRQAEVERQKKEARIALRSTIRPLRELAQGNETLAQEREDITKKLEAQRSRLAEIKRTSETLASEFQVLQALTAAPGMGHALGPKLREQRAVLYALQNQGIRIEQTRAEYVQVSVRATDLGEERLQLSDMGAAVAKLLEEKIESAAAIPPEELEANVHELLLARRDLVDRLKQDYDAYLDQLSKLLTEQVGLLARSETFRRFVDRHILWTRSTVPLYAVPLEGKGLRIDDPLKRLLPALLQDIRNHPITYAWMILLIAALRLFHPAMRRELKRLAQAPPKVLLDSYRPTLRAVGATVWLSATWPLLPALLGWRFRGVAGTNADLFNLSAAIASGLIASAAVLFTFTFIRRTCAPHGLACAHFRWDEQLVRGLAHQAIWFQGVAVVGAFFVAASESYSAAIWRDLVGRIALMVVLIALTGLVYRLLSPSRGVLAGTLRKQRYHWVHQMRGIWFPIALLLPLGIACASAVGYHAAGVEIVRRLVPTAWLIVAVVFLRALVVRWLLIAQRRLLISRAAEKAAGEQSNETGDRSPVETGEDPRLDVVVMGEQTRRLVRTVVAASIAVGLWGIWADMAPALGFLDEVRLWSYTVEVGAGGDSAAPTSSVRQIQYITLGNIVIAFLAAVVTWVLARNVPGLLEITLLQRLPLDRGGRFAVSSIARYLIAVVGLVVAFGYLGIGWTKVQWLVAAMTVGLGFGLQEIFANFVSGLILLFERPIRVGDTVTVGTISGTVTKIRIRATTITDWDRKELIIPNKEFVTGQVINWTLTDTILRIIIKVGIAYGSDTRRAEDVLYHVASRNEHVLQDPPPRVVFMAFGESSLDFELRVFVVSIDYFLQVRHELHLAIDREFRAAGIEIAFPQRDMHIRSIHQALSVAGGTSNVPVSARSAPRAEERFAESRTGSSRSPDPDDA